MRTHAMEPTQSIDPAISVGNALDYTLSTGQTSYKRPRSTQFKRPTFQEASMTPLTPARPHDRTDGAPLSVAPMMDYTDRHFRWVFRQITAHTLLYTEMITTGAILNGDREHLLGYDPIDHPVSLQLGGDQANALAECCRVAEDFGYDEVNLNVGCPSDRVQSGNFGACLMKSPQQVADLVEAMQKAVHIPISVKCRIGVDDLDHYDDLARFIQTVSEGGCRRFTVHARKAWLKGLSPKQNRTVPPLRYNDVYQLKEAFPQLFIEINGGITDFEQTETHLKHVDAVMIGRAAVSTPYLFAEADERFFGASTEPPSRTDIAHAAIPYLERLQRDGQHPLRVTRHLLNLFAGQPGARRWRRTLTEASSGPKASATPIQDALKAMTR